MEHLLCARHLCVTLFLQGGNYLHFPNKEIKMQRISLLKVTQVGLHPRSASY